MAYPNNPTAVGVVQIGGPGNPWVKLPKESQIDAFTGGGTTKTRDYAGAGEYVGTRITSAPADYGTTVKTRTKLATNALLELARQGCFGSLGVLDGCPALDITVFSMFRLVVDASLDAGELSGEGMVLDGLTQANDKQLDSFPVTAPGGNAGVRLYPLAHNVDVTNTQASDFNDIIALRTKRCAGDCGDEIREDDELIAVGGGISPATVPYIHYRARKDGAWKHLTLTGIADGSADSVTIAGDRILIGVSGTDAGLYAVSYADLLVQPTAIAATQVSAAVITAAATVVRWVGGSDVYAGGPSGALYYSRDGGYSFTAVVSGTAQNILDIHSRDENNVWIGGAAGVLLKRLNKGAITAVSPSVVATDDILSVQLPERGNEIYIGTDTAEIWYSKDGGSNWTQYHWTGEGVGTVRCIRFVGVRGMLMFFIQNDATPDGRVLVDYSGGFGSEFVAALGTYTAPSNNGLNGLAVATTNYAYAVGDIAASTNGFAGEISPV